MIRTPNIISVLALIFLCVSLAAADSRTLHTFSSPNIVQITSLPNDTNIIGQSNFSVYQFTLSTISAPLFSVAALQKESDSFAAFSFRVAILALVEYNDTISLENSTSFIDFLQFPLRWEKLVENDQNPGVEEFDTSLSIKSQNGNTTNVTLSAFISTNTTTFQNMVLSPTQFKYTLGFTNFPYQYQNSKVAIIKALYVQSDSISSNNQTAFTIGPNNITNTTSGSFWWNSQLLADGKNVSITVIKDVVWQGSQNLAGNHSQNYGLQNITNNVFAQQNETLTFLSFEFDAVQPQTVIWDPTVGVSNSTGQNSSGQNSTGQNSTGQNSTGTGNGQSNSNQTNDGYKIVYQASLLSYLGLGAIMILFF